MPEIHFYDKGDVIRRLETYLGMLFGDIDNKGIFDHVQQFNLQKGVAGHVVEQCIFGYPPDSRQEADLIIREEGVDYRTELKTTGMVVKKDPKKHYEAKEPMSITAVGVYDIGNQDFYTSHFWEKLEHMLIVYYHYAATHRNVTAYDYKDFPLVGYEFHTFSEDEVSALRRDWEIVRGLCVEVVERHPGRRDAAWKQAVKQDYIDSHGVLRPQLTYIDLAPLFPPRFRLKKPTVSMMISQHFGYELEQLPGRYTYISDIDQKCHELTARYKGKTVGELADMFGISRTVIGGREDKGISEHITVKMFGGDSNKLNKIELFEKFGLMAKSITITSTGSKTEDMKLYHMDFDELTQTAYYEEDGSVRPFEFSDSEMYAYFTNHEFLCILYEEPPAPRGEKPKLVNNKFIGFKRLVFSDEFIDTIVRALWTDTREKVMKKTLRDVISYDRYGNPVINKSGNVRSAPNFMKSSDNTVFLRGSGQDSSLKNKTECVNGIRMLPQYVWIYGTAVVQELERAPLL